MGKDTLSTRLHDETLDRVGSFMDDQGIENKSRAGEKLIEEGLQSAGYPPNYRETEQQYLSLIRGVGSVFGLTALILYGIGSFLPAFSRYGLGLAVASIAFYAGAEIIDRHGNTIKSWVKQKASEEADQWTASGGGGDDA